MTEFILVAGMFTGTHVWEETAAHLVAAGAGAHPVALAGLGGPRRGTGDAIDLETHIEDVLAVIDSIGGDRGQEIVLVGHDYGTYPVLGAAGRRAEHIARIISLDTGPGQDGVPALAVVPDPELRDEVIGRAGAERSGGDLAPPARDAWQRWGSTAGLPEAALERLTALASPQPLGTLLQPLRLSGEAAALPVTGVLCNANGASIELVQRQVDFGDPALGALADPKVSFFELPTGHWPMLSLPAELAQVLLRAAAGEGHRLVPPGSSSEPPSYLRPFPLDVPDLPGERTGNVDLYLPDAEGPRPAVLFVHGGPVPAGARPTPRDWPVLQGYARYAAAQGAVGVAFDHRLHSPADYPCAAADVAAAVEQVRADPRVDADRIALWFLSGGGLITADWLSGPPAWLRCLAASYPILVPPPGWGPVDSRFRPVDAVADAGTLPLVITRAGLENPGIAAGVEEFLTAAGKSGAHVEVIDVEHGRHGFEGLDPTEETREAVRRAMRSVLEHL